MTNEAVKEHLTQHLPAAGFDETGEWLNVQVEPAGWVELAKRFRFALHYDYLFCVSCVDWKTHLTMVYHLSSTQHRHTVVVKINLDRSAPVVETVSDLWRTAEFHERECFEMFGVRFHNHPDLRPLILPDDFEGYPMRKDFEDPINLIKL